MKLISYLEKFINSVGEVDIQPIKKTFNITVNNPKKPEDNFNIDISKNHSIQDFSEKIREKTGDLTINANNAFYKNNVKLNLLKKNKNYNIISKSDSNDNLSFKINSFDDEDKQFEVIIKGFDKQKISFLISKEKTVRHLSEIISLKTSGLMTIDTNDETYKNNEKISDIFDEYHIEYNISYNEKRNIPYFVNLIKKERKESVFNIQN